LIVRIYFYFLSVKNIFHSPVYLDKRLFNIMPSPLQLTLHNINNIVHFQIFLTNMRQIKVVNKAFRKCIELLFASSNHEFVNILSGMCTLLAKC